MSLCEWDPERDAPAFTIAGGTHGCANEATLSVGTGKNNWHLCADCAALPRFKRLRSRKPLTTRA